MALKHHGIVGKVHIRHIPGLRQVDDVLTKKTASSELIRKVFH